MTGMILQSTNSDANARSDWLGPVWFIPAIHHDEAVVSYGKRNPERKCMSRRRQIIITVSAQGAGTAFPNGL